MKIRSALVLVAFLAISFGVAALGSLSTIQNVDGWYATAEKASWNPPNAIFGPVWTLLYALMSVAAWLVWRERKRVDVRPALTVYVVQLVLNAAWTPIFFGAHQLGWALVEIVALWTAVLLTLLSFRGVSKTASWLFVPYLAWVTFAAFLNFTLWRMNSA